MSNLGTRVKQLREELGITQSQLADTVKQSYVSIANVETSRVLNPRYIRELAKALNTTTSFLLDGAATNKIIVDEPVHLLRTDKEVLGDSTKNLYIVEVDKEDKLFLTGSAKTIATVKKIIS